MSVREIGKNKYKIEVVYGYNGSHKKRLTKVYNGKKKEAEQLEAELITKLKNNQPFENNKITVSSLCDEYLKYKIDKIALKTYKTYEMYINKYIKTCIGHIKLKNLTVKLLEDFYSDLRNNTNLADLSIKHIYQIVNGILTCGKKWGYVINNVNENVEHIKVDKKEIQCYNPDEVQELVRDLKNESIKYQALILLALDSGARRGELTGLTWEDIDFEENSININKITQYISGVGIFEKEPKNKTSERKVIVSETTMRVLKQYQTNQLILKLKLGQKWGNSKRVFTTDYGEDMHPDTPSKILTKIIKKYNLRYINFHALRHTSISLQINNDIPIQLISKRAGHASTTITYNTYSHFFDDSFKGIADTMNNYLKDSV